MVAVLYSVEDVEHENNKIDALHLHNMKAAKSLFRVNKKYNLPVILDIHENLPEFENILPSGEGDDRTKIAFVGRPNVGKSSICNRLLNMERLIVSDVPGTTRETVELDLDYDPEDREEAWKFRLFDTAGLKRHKRIDTSLDYFSSVLYFYHKRWNCGFVSSTGMFYVCVRFIFKL